LIFSSARSTPCGKSIWKCFRRNWLSSSVIPSLRAMLLIVSSSLGCKQKLIANVLYTVYHYQFEKEFIVLSDLIFLKFIDNFLRCSCKKSQRIKRFFRKIILSVAAVTPIIYFRSASLRIPSTLAQLSVLIFENRCIWIPLVFLSRPDGYHQ
jgi:hypothetical protein